ncbi:MAG: hypothetical protein PHO37_15975 [Kiritimatiellae bacterium]|nr:hypothetical protein [Kiritimatiellia bacterium]
MSDFKRFDLKNLDDLRAALDQRGLELPISNNLAILGEKVVLAGRTLANRFVVQPMEGVDGDPVTGAPGELTLRRYRRFAGGGSGLIWAESLAVVPEGASGARQLRVTRENLDAYKRLVDATRQSALDEAGHAVTCVVQLTHSGRYSRPGGVVTPLKAQDNPELDRALGMEDLKPVSDDYLMRLQDAFVDSACLMAQAGFDGIDMKAVHGYLVAELLGARQREGRFGGSYENRTRFLRECVQRMMEELPPSCFVTTRTTVLEPSPWPYGWGVAERGVKGGQGQTAWTLDLSEPKRLMRELAGMGVPLFNVSMGYPRFQPYMNRPHDNPLAGKAAPPEYPLEGVVRFQQIAREMQRGAPELPLVTAGLAWLRHLMPQVAAGLVEQGWCTLIGQGRGAFAYPNSVRDILEKGLMNPRKCCITCSLCSQIMADGLGRGGCPVRDKDIYGPELVKGRAWAKQQEEKR